MIIFVFPPSYLTERTPELVFDDSFKSSKKEGNHKIIYKNNLFRMISLKIFWFQNIES